MDHKTVQTLMKQCRTDTTLKLSVVRHNYPINLKMGTRNFKVVGVVVPAQFLNCRLCGITTTLLPKFLASLRAKRSAAYLLFYYVLDEVGTYSFHLTNILRKMGTKQSFSVKIASSLCSSQRHEILEIHLTVYYPINFKMGAHNFKVAGVVMTTRIKKLRSVFARQNIDAFLVQNDVNITYLTGFPASESWLFIGLRQAFYITDFRYVLEAQKGLKGIRVVRYTRSIYETLFKLTSKSKVKRIGIDERHLTLAQYKTLLSNCPKGIKLVKANDCVEHFREIKSTREVTQVKKALTIHKQAHQFLKGVIRPKISEKEVLLGLECFVKSKGAGFSFDAIVASGVNSCYPHAKVTERKIRANEVVLIDMGIDVGGYKSDLTRMFFLGRIPKLVRQVNDHVRAAQQKAIEKIKAGISSADVDYEARNYLEGHGLAKYFGHALGHGVGLEIHEGPRLAQNNPALLREGMIITVEPAVYIPGKFGIRIEDMVLVTKRGCNILSDNIY